MAETEASVMTLLHELDDPDSLEWPQGYDRDVMASPFKQLLAMLNANFATHCIAEHDTQDSSQYGRIEIPAEATVCGTRIVVAVSKFGSLAVVSAENPGAFLGTSDAQAEGELDAYDLQNVEHALTALGYIVIPEELLARRYDGPTRLPSYGPPDWQPSWWDRYFGSF